MEQHPSFGAFGSESNYIFHELLRKAMPNGEGRKSFKRGESIFEEGKNANGLFCILSGKAKITKTGENGKEQILRLVSVRDVIGYGALLGGETYKASCIALEDTMVGYVPRGLFFEILNSSPQVAMMMLKMLSQELDESENRRVDIATKTVKERVAEVLLLLKETYGFLEDGATLDIKLSRDDLAAMVGAAKEVVIRALAQLKEEGLIESKGRQIRIVDDEGLLKTARIRD